MPSADIGLIGLAVMGQNLVLNMNDNGYTVAVFNRTTSKVDEFMNGPAKGTKIVGTQSLTEFVSSLKRPRRIMLMVKAGEVVDQFIQSLLPHLEKGDIIIDGGNSLYTDSNRRTETLAEQGIIYLGVGISGGEEGARHGPSIMPGGNKEGWPYVKEIFQTISAKVDGEPCCQWVGEGGAGHYVKMVHNGIEYGDIALMWRGGCIIRSKFLSNIKTAYNSDPQLENLLLDDFFKQEITSTYPGWKKTIMKAVELGIPTPAFSSALAFFEGYRSEYLPANLLQAQRDYFGAHTYERLDSARGDRFHTDWTGSGGNVSSTTYNA